MNGYDACKQIKQLYDPDFKLFALEKKKCSNIQRFNSDNLSLEKPFVQELDNFLLND